MKPSSDKSITLHEALQQQRQVVFGNRRYWFHIGIWVLVALYTVLYYNATINGFNTGLFVGSKGRLTGYNLANAAAGILLGSLLAAAMVYFFLLFVVAYARYKRQKRYLIIGVLINSLIWLTIIIIAGLITGYRQGFHNKPGTPPFILIICMAVYSVALSSYFFALYYFIDLYDQQKTLARFQEVFTEKLQAESSFLRTQINPHFLFNTLNNIYALTLGKSDDAAHVTLQLRELISYMVTDCTRDLVPLSGEIDFLKNYITLEQLRNRREQTAIDFSVEGDPAGRHIAPLLLINFIENAFKHGVKAGIDHSFVQIMLSITDKELMLRVRNSKPQQPVSGQSVAHSGGIGIRNVKRRLELLYPGRHRLRISQSPHEYGVHLTIQC